MKKLITAVTVAVVMAAGTMWAEDLPTEPRGGQPPKGSEPSVKNFAE